MRSYFWTRTGGTIDARGPHFQGLRSLRAPLFTRCSPKSHDKRVEQRRNVRKVRCNLSYFATRGRCLWRALVSRATQLVFMYVRTPGQWLSPQEGRPDKSFCLMVFCHLLTGFAFASVRACHVRLAPSSCSDGQLVISASCFCRVGNPSMISEWSSEHLRISLRLFPGAALCILFNQPVKLSVAPELLVEF